MHPFQVFGLMFCVGILIPFFQLHKPDGFSGIAEYGVVAILFSLIGVVFSQLMLRIVNDPDIPFRNLARIAYHLAHVLVAPLFLGATISALCIFAWTRGSFHWGYVLVNAAYFVVCQFGLRRLPESEE